MESVQKRGDLQKHPVFNILKICYNAYVKKGTEYSKLRTDN